MRAHGRNGARDLTRTIASFLAALVALAWIAPAFPALAEPAPIQASDEYSLKAAFLYNFARGTKWPESAFRDADAPLVVAVLGKDPFGKKLDETLRDKKAGTRRIVIERFEGLDDVGRCHVLFVPATEEKRLDRIRELLDGKPVLIVCESLEAVEHGAQCGFYVEKGKLRFAINTSSVRAARLEVSSELLKLARIVDRSAEEGR